MIPKTIIIALLSLFQHSYAFVSPHYIGRYRNELLAKVDPNENREGSLAAATKTLGKVPYGEQSRKYRRTVFQHDDWVNHRSTAVCEKIYSSPVPLVYTRHTARFLSIWALLVPCALYSSFSEASQVLATLPASMILAFFLFGIDELAMQLEEPFSILPMGYFCKDILDSSTILVEMDDLEVQEEVIS